MHTDANASLLFSPGLKLDGAVLSNDSFGIDGLNLYPNPIKASNSYVQINTTSSEAISVIIFDVLGKQISNQKITDNKINISSLNTGLYLVQISQGDKKSTKKLLVN